MSEFPEREIFCMHGRLYTKYEVERLQTQTMDLTLADILSFFLNGSVNAFEEVLRRLVSALEAVGLRYCIAGRSAVVIYGRPIRTGTIDLLVEPNYEGIASLLRNLERAGWKPPGSAHDINYGHLTVLTDTPLRIDLIPAFQKGQIMQLEGAVKLRVGAVDARVSRIDDLIPWLLKYGRYEDALYLLVNYQGEIDAERMQTLASMLGVERQLNRAIEEYRLLMKKTCREPLI